MPKSISWLELVGITSDSNCVFADERLSCKIGLLGAKDPDEIVLFTESDSFIGDNRSVPKIGTLVDDGKMDGFVARFCADMATPVAIDWILPKGLLLLLWCPLKRLSFSGVGIRSRTLWAI